VVKRLLDDPVVDRLASAGRLLRLQERFGAERLEAACERALHFADPSYKTVKHILVQGLERQKLTTEPAPSPAAKTFVRSAGELLGHLFGGVTWN